MAVNPPSSFILPPTPSDNLAGITRYMTSNFTGTVRNIPVNPNLIAGPGTASATRERGRIEERNTRMQRNRPYQSPREILNRPDSAVANQKSKAMAYYFEGQSSGNFRQGEFSIDPWQMFTGAMPSEAIKKAKNLSYNSQDPSLTNLPSNYYLGFGNQIKGPDDYISKNLTQLRRFGGLGDIGRDTAIGQMATLIRNTAEMRKIRMTQEAAAKIPKAHWQPSTNGQYQLGNMQGQRERAWERRQLQKQTELQKKKLVRVETKDRTQQESPNVERASTR